MFRSRISVGGGSWILTVRSTWEGRAGGASCRSLPSSCRWSQSSWAGGVVRPRVRGAADGRHSGSIDARVACGSAAASRAAATSTRPGRDRRTAEPATASVQPRRAMPTPPRAVRVAGRARRPGRCRCGRFARSAAPSVRRRGRATGPARPQRLGSPQPPSPHPPPAHAARRSAASRRADRRGADARCRQAPARRSSQASPAVPLPRPRLDRRRRTRDRTPDASRAVPYRQSAARELSGPVPLPRPRPRAQPAARSSARQPARRFR